MDQIRVRTQDQDIDRRPVRLPHLQIAATTSGAADTFYTVRSDVMAEIKHLSVVNTSGSAAWITLHSVPDGGAIATNNAELVEFSIAANNAVDLTDLVAGLYDPGTVFRTWAQTTNVLVVHGWASEIL